MSKGPGKIQKQLIRLFQKNQRRHFSTRQICQRVFRVTLVEKKHRVSILRALKRLSANSKLNLWRAVLKNRRDDFWFNGDQAFRRSRPPQTVAPAAKARPKKAHLKSLKR